MRKDNTQNVGINNKRRPNDANCYLITEEKIITEEAKKPKLSLTKNQLAKAWAKILSLKNCIILFEKEKICKELNRKRYTENEMKKDRNYILL